MINCEITKTNVVINEESNVLKEERTNSETLPVNHIPSYVGLSCAVSGYRSINKYDGAVREHSANLTPLNLLCGHCKDRPSNFNNENIKNNIPNISSNVITEGVSGASNKEYKMNISSSKQSFTSHQFVSLEHVTNINSANTIQITNCFSQEVDDQSKRKSFVQQRIERLYGPSALGIGFQARRSFLETLKNEERKEGKDDESSKISVKENGREFPSVFRHLRPEFRHQLPVRSKLVYPREVSNGYSDKDDSNQTNGLNSLESNKTWKSLSKELESVCKVNETDSFNAKPEKLLLKSISNECKNNEPAKTTSNLNETCNDVQDGNYFLKLIAIEVTILGAQAQNIEKDLKFHEDLMSEEVKGKLLAASGKAKLLITQKLEQFKGLCFKNINTSPSDEFATTNEDLAGFWDMVKIQVENVKDLFKEIDQLRLNNWKEVKNQISNSTNKIPAKKVITIKKPKSTNTDATKKAIKSDKQESSSDERRKQMREALNAKRKQAMKMKNSSKPEGEIEIFVHSK
ncbi:UNVERIFIED_CONTAM: hypothetical protein RMT77_017359 [Armadillidium vulgare]